MVVPCRNSAQEIVESVVDEVDTRFNGERGGSGVELRRPPRGFDEQGLDNSFDRRVGVERVVRECLLTIANVSHQKQSSDKGDIRS